MPAAGASARVEDDGEEVQRMDDRAPELHHKVPSGTHYSHYHYYYYLRKASRLHRAGLRQGPGAFIPVSSVGKPATPKQVGH